MQIGLLGYGTVGKAFYALCEEQPTLKVNTLLTRRPRGLVCREVSSFEEILNDATIELVVELIGGIHPAYEYMWHSRAAPWASPDLAEKAPQELFPGARSLV